MWFSLSGRQYKSTLRSVHTCFSFALFIMNLLCLSLTLLIAGANCFYVGKCATRWQHTAFLYLHLYIKCKDLVSVILMLCVGWCADNTGREKDKIVGGDYVPIAEAPYQVSTYMIFLVFLKLSRALIQKWSLNKIKLQFLIREYNDCMSGAIYYYTYIYYSWCFDFDNLVFFKQILQRTIIFYKLMECAFQWFINS